METQSTFPARKERFEDIRTFIEDTCARAGVPQIDGLRVTLLVEELFVNTVDHGHGVDTDAPVCLALKVTGDVIVVDYRDSAPPFNPFAQAPRASVEGDLDARPVGGLGIHLITTMAREIAYAHQDGCNCVSFRLVRAD